MGLEQQKRKGPKITMTTVFQSNTLDVRLKSAIEKMGFKSPTEIQSRAIPPGLEGKDLLAQAATGTGKTLAFSVPVLQALITDRNKRCLIMAPTRELAIQIEKTLQDLIQKGLTIKTACLVGGTPMMPQLRALTRGPQIVVGTPGRLIDHFVRESLLPQDYTMVVLDEADRMLDMGFIPQIRRILKALPRERQTLMFSATFPKQVLDLTREFQKNPHRVTVESVKESRPEIDQQAVFLNADANRNSLLMKEIDTRDGSILIFARTQIRTERVARFLKQQGVEVEMIHGGRTQGQRQRALQAFRSQALRVLVATDIAARGIDIDHVNHVVNFDLPQVAEDYIHRIGRTGRAGRKGSALSFVAADQTQDWRSICRVVKQEFGVQLAQR
jgi:ATP-dependent RNA helicase DeaD